MCSSVCAFFSRFDCAHREQLVVVEIMRDKNLSFYPDKPSVYAVCPICFLLLACGKYVRAALLEEIINNDILMMALAGSECDFFLIQT